MLEQSRVFRVCAHVPQLHPGAAALDLRQGFHGRQIRPGQVTIDERPLSGAALVHLVDCVITAKIQNGMTERARQLYQARNLQQRMPGQVVGDLEGVTIKVRSEQILIERQQVAGLVAALLRGSCYGLYHCR